MTTRTFPSSSSSTLFADIETKIRGVRAELSRRNTSRNLGLLYTPPNHSALQIYTDFLEENPNHLGNWSLPQSKPYATEVFEQELVAQMADLYGGGVNDFRGYATSGATEGNIFSAWIGRKKLETQIPKKSICIIGTDLTHYSVRKAADVIGVDYIVSPLSRTGWNMDPKAFSLLVENLYAKEYQGFLISLTAGYTTTGTSDHIENILSCIADLKERLANIHFFVWVDAALHGLVAPFVHSAFRPLAVPGVESLVVDFHKFAGVPYPAGLLIYRAPLGNLIGKAIDYLPYQDETLLGSRPGAPAAAMWGVVNSLGKEGFTALVMEQLENKEACIAGIRNVFPHAEIVNDTASSSFGVIFPERLPQTVEDKYWLFSKKTPYHFEGGNVETHRVYKFYFLPHVSRAAVDEFISDLGLLAGKAPSIM